MTVATARPRPPTRPRDRPPAPHVSTSPLTLIPKSEGRRRGCNNTCASRGPGVCLTCPWSVVFRALSALSFSPFPFGEHYPKLRFIMQTLVMIIYSLPSQMGTMAIPRAIKAPCVLWHISRKVGGGKTTCWGGERTKWEIVSEGKCRSS